MESDGTDGVQMVSDLLYFQGWMRAIQGGVPENNFWVSWQALYPPSKSSDFQSNCDLEISVSDDEFLK